MWELINKQGETMELFTSAEQANNWQDANAENENYELAYINNEERENTK